MNYSYENSRSKKTLAIALAVTLLVVITISVAIGTANRRANSDDTTPAPGNTTPADTTPSDGTTPGTSENPLPSFLAPVQAGSVSFDFSDSLPVFSLTMNDYRTHNGVDITAPLGAEVFAVADGTVKEVWEDVRMGTCVSIAHAGNAVSTYKNLNPYLAENIEAGAKVKAGDVIGLVGDSAMIEIAQESHLHYELEIDSKLVDPCQYITFQAEESAEE